MTKNQFEDTLRQYLGNDPFVPFVVELADGREIVIRQPPVVFCDGAASFIDPGSGALVDFFHSEATLFRDLTQ